jgi:hypothetical protein
MDKTTHINEIFPVRWTCARDTLLLAIWLNRTEALCADGLLIRHCAEFRSKFGNQITSQFPVAIVHKDGSRCRRGCWRGCWRGGWRGCRRGRWRGRRRDYWCWYTFSLIKSSGLEREGGRDTRAAFTRTVQVLERNNGRRDASLLVLDRVSKWEIDFYGGIVERMTELGIASQGLRCMAWKCT